MITNLEKTPESRGISSRALLGFVRKLDKKKIPMHSLLIARGDDIVLNAYWTPFDNKALHRQNSVTKSFVSLAIGLLEEEGKISLDDKVISFFPEAKGYDVPKEIEEQTVDAHSHIFYDLGATSIQYFSILTALAEAFSITDYSSGDTYRYTPKEICE